MNIGILCLGVKLGCDHDGHEYFTLKDMQAKSKQGDSMDERKNPTKDVGKP